ncbi:MAG: exosortase/archaeosortase family protein [Thaumarchaeota archaeon]|nr:exosortase/archaeosortase family protein [Nitrososphaerota archaeon]
MKAEFRFLVWLAASAALSAAAAPNFLNLLNQSLGDTFGSVFPAIPFAALLTLIFALRWEELKGVLAEEGKLSSQLPTRIIGAAVIAGLLLLEPLTNQAVETAGIAVILTFYGASLAINPLTKRFMLPYALVYSAGIGAPSVLQGAFGEPLATLSSSLSSRFVGVLGFPVAWQGTQFQFLSKSGEVVSGAVTPGCSSIISVTTFLGLLALMHMDLRKDARSTLTLAVVGILVLTILNSVRIMLLMWVGYVDGVDAFWGVHNWIGYALFVGFYLAILPVYSRMGRNGTGVYPTGLQISSTQT